MIDERTKKILCAVVESYIEKPEPVGSRYIMKKYGFDICSATIRNIMSDLEDAGFFSNRIHQQEECQQIEHIDFMSIIYFKRHYSLIQLKLKSS
jgi:hypothetical protein